MKLHDMKVGTLIAYLAVFFSGCAIGMTQDRSPQQPPASSKGVSVTPLGDLQASSLTIQLGLEGYAMQMREVVVEPGGVIAQHSHASRPGLVKTVSGSWVEVREDGEVPYPATKKAALVEDENTVHWLYNDGSEPAVAIVCGLSKS